MNIHVAYGEACPHGNMIGSHAANFGDVPDAYDGFGIFKKLGKKIKKQYGKGLSVKGLKSSVKGTVHTVGKVADSKITKGILAAGLAATGVGVGASAAIMGTTGAIGGAAKKGGGLKKAVRGAATGAATGAAAGVVGKVLPKVPGLNKPITGLRKAASGTVLRKFQSKSTKAALSPAVAPLPSSSEIVSYDDDKKLDALTSGGLPKVGVTPSGVMKMRPVRAPKPITPVSTAVEAATSAEPLIKEAGKEALKKHKRSVVSRLKDEAMKRAKDSATEMATSIVTPPSANPLAPQGGFPAMPFDPSPTQNKDSEVTPAQAGVGGGFGELFKSPIALAAIAGIAFLAMKKR